MHFSVKNILALPKKIFPFAEEYRYLLVFIILPLISLLLHAKPMQYDIKGRHFWRQAETQTVINNFAKEDINILNPRVHNLNNGGLHRMEFPLMQWLFAWPHKLFGEHILFTRILTWLVSIGSVVGMFYLVRHFLKHTWIAFLSAMTFMFGPSFFYFSINPLPDNFALCFAIWGTFTFFRYTRSGKLKFMVLTALLFTISTLAKLPFILYFCLPGIYILLDLFKFRTNSTKHNLLALAICFLLVLPALIWYVIVIPHWGGNGIIAGIMDIKREQLPELWEIFRSNLEEMFPNQLLNKAALPVFLTGLILIFINKIYKHRLFPVLLVWCLCTTLYYLFEINMIRTNHDYYMFPFLPQIFLIAAYGIYILVKSRWQVFHVLVLLSFIFIIPNALRFSDGSFDANSWGPNEDYLRYKKELRAAVPDTARIITVDDVSPYLQLYYIDKKGWANSTRYEQNMPREIDRLVRYLRVTHLYSDNREIDEDPKLQPYLDKLLAQYGSIKIFKLKPVDVIPDELEVKDHF